MSVTSLPLSLLGIPQNLCFEGTFAEALVQALSLVRVLVPNTITNVVVGPDAPSDDQRSYVWFKLTNSGTFEGIFIFASGKWNQITPVPQELPWVYGDSTAPPDGYIAANDPSSPLSGAQQTHLETLWFPPGPVGPWSIYQVIYVGF